MISTTSAATTRTKTTPPTVMAALPRYLSIRGTPDRETRRDSRHGLTRRPRRRAASALAKTEHDADGTARGHEGQRPEPPGRHGHHGRKGEKTGDEVRHRLGQHLEQGDPIIPITAGPTPLSAAFIHAILLTRSSTGTTESISTNEGKKIAAPLTTDPQRPPTR